MHGTKIVASTVHGEPCITFQKTQGGLLSVHLPTYGCGLFIGHWTRVDHEVGELVEVAVQGDRQRVGSQGHHSWNSMAAVYGRYLAIKKQWCILDFFLIKTCFKVGVPSNKIKKCGYHPITQSYPDKTWWPTGLRKLNVDRPWHSWHSTPHNPGFEVLPSPVQKLSSEI